MKLIKIFILLFIQASFAQGGEIFLTTGHTEIDFYNAINDPDINTITFKTNINITQNNKIVPSDKTLRFFEGNKLIINNGIQLDINGNIDAGLYQIFEIDNSDQIEGKPILEYIYPQWFGAKGDKIKDNTDDLQKSINLAFKFSVPLKIPSGHYKTKRLYINNGNKPLIIEGVLNDVSGAGGIFKGSTLELIDDPNDQDKILLHFGVNKNKELITSANTQVKNINFVTYLSRDINKPTYAIKGGSREGGKWFTRSRIKDCTFFNFHYGLYFGGYSDGIHLSDLKFKVVNKCIYIVEGDASRIENIIAEPYIDYVLYSFASIGLSFSNGILRAPTRTITPKAFRMPFIFKGTHHNAIEGLTYVKDGPIKVENAYIETSDGIAILANTPNVYFNNISYNLVDGVDSREVQNKNTISLLNSAGANQMVNCRFTNFKIQRQNTPDNNTVDVFVGDYDVENIFDILPDETFKSKYCLPNDLVLENWNINPTTDAFHRKEDGVFKYFINGVSYGGYEYKEANNEYLIPTINNGKQEITGSIKIQATGGEQLVKLIKTSVPSEGILSVLVYQNENSNEFRSCTYRISQGSHNNAFIVSPIGNQNANTLYGYTSPVFIGDGIFSNSSNYNSEIDLKFRGTSNKYYKIVFTYSGISKLP